jgi:hypothetical protein
MAFLNNNNNKKAEAKPFELAGENLFLQKILKSQYSIMWCFMSRRGK